MCYDFQISHAKDLQGLCYSGHIMYLKADNLLRHDIICDAESIGI